MIAFDECHVAKNPNSQQGKGILKIFMNMFPLYKEQKEKCIIDLRKKEYQ